MSKTTSDATTKHVQAATLSDSERQRLFAEARRRHVLDCLEATELPVELDALAAAVADAESDGDSSGENHVERVEISLHHNHLPRMDDAGVLDYDHQANRVTRLVSTDYAPARDAIKHSRN